MNKDENLYRLREKMASKNIQALIIPSADPHQSEYVADHWQARQWITGFSGSAGTAVVTRDRAILWTDFRYWIQASEQIKSTGFELFKQGEPDVLSFDKWIAEKMKTGDLIAVDGRMISAADMKKYQELFIDRGLVFDVGSDLISDLWEDRPPMPASAAFALDVSYAGETRGEKLTKIREKMENAGADTHLICALDDIAWTFNLRGDDVLNTPVNVAFALISLGGAILFVNSGKIDAALAGELARDKIDLMPYGQIFNALENLPPDTRILLDIERVSASLYRAIDPNIKILEQVNPATEFKAVKNLTEISHMRETAEKDGRAMVNFLHWIETTKSRVSEISAAKKIFELRSKAEGFVDNSFNPIMAFGPHSAMCHYSAVPKTDLVLEKNNMFLTDSGGNYLSGTTDITRTLHLGSPGEQEIRDYTLVLKGHIAVASALFPKGTKGFQIDTLSRQYLWNQSMDFGHGTGHGVGFFLCVHEGPARISPHPVDVALQRGMLLTNEPGIYRENQYGIRLENMILVAESGENQFGRFFKFENLTLCHFETGLMDKNMMTGAEISWVNAYHKEVYEKLAPGLEEPVREWLKTKTASI